MNLLIKNGHIIDPADNREGIADILIQNGRVMQVDQNISVSPDV